MAYKDIEVRRARDRERFRKRTAERIAAGLCPSAATGPGAGAQRLRSLRRQAQQGEPRPRRPSSGRGQAQAGSREGESLREGAVTQGEGRARRRGYMHPVRRAPVGGRSLFLRTLPGEASRVGSREIRRRQGCRPAVRRRQRRRQAPCRPHPQQETPEGASRRRALHPLRAQSTRRRRYHLSAVPRQAPGGGARPVCGAARVRALRAMRRPGDRRPVALRPLRRHRGCAPLARTQEREVPAAIC